jgi:ribosomal protein S12 methylthiotransferase accessory factor
VTVDQATRLPLEESRWEVERYLRARLCLANAAAGLSGPPDLELNVALLGVQDMLWSKPTQPWHSRLLRMSGRVLAVYLYEGVAVIGPLGTATRPHPPCFHCVARRWQQLRWRDERDAIELGWPVNGVARDPYITGFTLEAVWRVVESLVDAAGRVPAGPGERWVPNGVADGVADVYELRLDTLQVRRYPILADSECPVCGHPKPDSAAQAVIGLSQAPKRRAEDSRLRDVSEYRLPVAAYLNPVCGALGRGTGHRLGSNTAAPAIGYVSVRGLQYLHDSFWGGHADRFDTSVLIGILEGLERHAGIRPRGKATVVHDSYANLGASALDPRTCGLYPDAFYAKDSDYVQFTPDLPTSWVWGYSLRDRRSILVPESTVYYHLPRNHNLLVRECSNGCATGCGPEEAILQGLLEVVERDAFLLAWYGGRGLPEIDPRSCTNPRTRFMVDRIQLCGYDLRLFDNRIDLPIPVVTAVAVRRDGGPGRLIFGAGASLNPEEAIRSAVYEVAYPIPDFAEETIRSTPELEAMAADFWKVVLLQHHQRLFGLPAMAQHVDFLLRPQRTLPIAETYRDWYRDRPAAADLLDDVRFCVGQVTRAGFDVIVVDQTSPEQHRVGLRTVRVLAPGLLPIDFGWAKQRALHMPRMYSAFRRAGWRSTDLAASDLHFVPHPFP